MSTIAQHFDMDLYRTDAAAAITLEAVRSEARRQRSLHKAKRYALMMARRDPHWMCSGRRGRNCHLSFLVS